VEIQKWLPERFSEFVGNSRLISYFQNGISTGCGIGNTLITGPSRSGKTAFVKFFIRACFCCHRDPATGDPCGRCQTCTDDIGTNECWGIFSYCDPDQEHRPVDLHYVPIDCPRTTEKELRSTLDDLRDTSGVRIVYLDEVHRLVHRNMDEMLLKIMEERNFVWIASSASTTGLERMFLNRFPIKRRTNLPGTEELAIFITHRCRAWQIDWDEPSTLTRLAERSHHTPGLALQVLVAAAAEPDRLLTGELVEEHEFEEAGQ